MNKKELRRSLLRSRQAQPKEQWQIKSDCLCQHLRSLPQFQQARTILAYFSFRQEPDLSCLFNDPNRRWGFPRCVGKFMSWHLWRSGDRLITGAYGIHEPHPDSPLCHFAEVDLILVPAVACDERGYRLGYGGGFYDRFLGSPQWSNKPTIGIVFADALLPQLPVEPWDQKLNGACTELGVKLFNA